MKKQIRKIVLNIVFYLVMTFFIFISFIVLKSYKTGEQAEILGYKFYVVLTGSMVPTINPGDLIIVKDVPTNEIEVNDIITFSSERISDVTTHRVKEILSKDKLQFVTKGDANNTEDPAPIKETLVQGKVVKCISKIGNIMKWMKEHLITLIISILLIVVFIALMVRIVKKPKKIEVKK